MYHDGNRRLQVEFDSRRISDRLEEKRTATRRGPNRCQLKVQWQVNTSDGISLASLRFSN